MPGAAGLIGVAGSNIDNSVAGGITYPAGGASSPVVPAWQPTIGDYVQVLVGDSTGDKPAADTNYIGVNTRTKWKTNAVNQGTMPTGGGDMTAAPQPDWKSATNDNTARGGLAQFVKAAGTIAAGGRCNITTGSATSNGSGTNICLVTGGVETGDFFWAPVFAAT